MEMTREARSHHVMRLDLLTSLRVRNHEGDDLGVIEDLVFDREEGRIRYAILSFGGFLGIGDKLFAVPWSAFQHSPTEDKFILNIPKETLQKAPGFERDQWPNMADADWGTRVHDAYGIRPYWEL